MAMPTILSMIVLILYNMADTFFVGQTGNSLYISAVSLASPVFLIFTAFTSMFGAGGSSVISRVLGMGNQDKAKKTSAFVCYVSIIFGILMSAVVLIGMEPLLKFIGTDAQTHAFIDDPEVVDYGTHMLVALQLAGPILGLISIGANTLQAMGKALAAFILNLLRQEIFLIPRIFILNCFFGLSEVVYSNPIADYLAVFVSYIVCIKYMRQMKHNNDTP